jgi:hypothetical protein
MFESTGTLARKRGSGRPRVSDETVESVRQFFAEQERPSLRKACTVLQIPVATVHKILHRDLHLQPYKYQLVQALQHGDYHQRVAYAETMLRKSATDPDFLRTVLFSDEATFYLDGSVNRHNLRIWGSANPRAIVQHQRESPRLNVWCAVSADTVIGPFFFAETTVNSSNYLDMLENFLVPQLQGNSAIFFQQDGAPPHWAQSVRDFLDVAFTSRWIGRGGPIPWPPRSPDLTPMDFFLWGYVKDKVFQEQVTNVADLKRRIREVIQDIPQEMRDAVWKNLEKRLHMVVDQQGGHIENNLH